LSFFADVRTLRGLEAVGYGGASDYPCQQVASFSLDACMNADWGWCFLLSCFFKCSYYPPWN